MAPDDVYPVDSPTVAGGWRYNLASTLPTQIANSPKAIMGSQAEGDDVGVVDL